MDEDHILGYIDMRRVIAIREGSKMVNFDGTRSAVNGIVNKLKGFMSAMGGTGSNGGTARPVLELVTSSRVYTLCPCTGESPGSVSMLAATSGPSVYGKPLYLFGWPFPVPELEGAVMSSGEDGDEEDDRALAESDAEAIRAANAMLMAQDAGSVSAPEHRLRRHGAFSVLSNANGAVGSPSCVPSHAPLPPYAAR